MRIKRQSMRTGMIQYGQFTSMFNINNPYEHQFNWVFERENAAVADWFPPSLIKKLNENSPPDSDYWYEAEE